MRYARLAALAALLLAAIPAVARDAPIYVVRHFDTPAGARDPDLLPRGTRRADRLATWFRGKKLTAIFVSDFRRTRQTVAPLATKRGIDVQTYDPRDTPGIVARARAAGGPVLIVGHSNTVPDIVAQLGGARPVDLEHGDFGDIWTVRDGRTVHGRIE
ncbi:phosphoglycerate mutase family protein [Sphingomonas sp.]|uniref:SixA phosphatase family protein n=1 Tax=Sphingomonas sp. TaxID=28214 RepID=UPI001EBFD27A|nr:phosphoglycerate mutase family protein [Sphingomonas sp.]MBX3594010.1 histidine phosphatase family protein [Sphingomonas sp.]